MEKQLKTIIDTNKIPAELSVTYDDMHGLWGGTTITVTGDGSLERKTRELGAPQEVERKQIAGRELVELVRLIVELRAWEQCCTDEPPVADESRAYLTISDKESASRVWERVNEMDANNRLVQIKTRLEKL
jgi:hypothetical protein